MNKPFYDPFKTYEENYAEGPSFTEVKKYWQIGAPQFKFLGQNVHLPFGIPAGPLLNSKFIQYAFEMGFDLCVYKTVRANSFPCHDFPNVLSLAIEGDLTPEKLTQPIVANNKYRRPLSITNSFGVPSRKPEIWQEDVKRAIPYEGKGQLLILSFMGTVKKGQTQKAFIDDFVLAAQLAYETGAKVLEANLSCPNIGNEGLVCYNLAVTEKIVKKIRSVIHNVPLVLKVGYYQNNKDLEKLAAIANGYANDVAGINTLQATVVNEHGKQALPGPSRLLSGICGDGIRWAGIDFVRRLKKIKDQNKYMFSITGIGGVMKPADYTQYRKVGADAVMSATGAMWNPLLAQEVKKEVGVALVSSQAMETRF